MVSTCSQPWYFKGTPSNKEEYQEEEPLSYREGNQHPALRGWKNLNDRAPLFLEDPRVVL